MFLSHIFKDDYNWDNQADGCIDEYEGNDSIFKALVGKRIPVEDEVENISDLISTEDERQEEYKDWMHVILSITILTS